VLIDEVKSRTTHVQVEIFGCRKKPPIKDTKLRIIDIAPSSSGYYTCKLFLLGALDSDPSVFSETFFLNVTGMGRNALTGKAMFTLSKQCLQISKF